MNTRLERLELEILPQLTLCAPDARPTPARDAAARNAPDKRVAFLPRSPPPEAARRRETLARMRAELELINARISGGHSNMERRVCSNGACMRMRALVFPR